MKSRRLIMIIFVMMTPLFMVDTTIAPTATTLGTSPKPCTANVGADFTLDITVGQVTELFSWQINMTYDPTVLTVLNVVEGPFLKSVGDTWPFDPVNETVAGWLFAGASLMPIPEHGASGGGVLATITLHVKTKGKSNLHFTPPIETGLFTWDPIEWVPVPLEFTAIDGFFQYPLGDANSDGKVDRSDLLALSTAFGSLLSKPNWNANCDLNKDNKVDASDLFLLSKNYGKT